MARWASTLLLAALPALGGAHTTAAPFEWHLPRGFPTPFVPADNPMSVAKVALGRRLFFETKLSVTGRYSCASCHDPARSYTDGRARAVGATGAEVPHSAMTLINVAYNLSYGWQHPEISSLEAQMRQPLFNRHPVEIGLSGREGEVCAALAADAGYAQQFAAVFGGAITTARIIEAIAAFERTLIVGRSDFDAYVFDGQHAALSPIAKRGMALFFSRRIGCAGCHSGFNFSGNWRDRDGPTGKAGFADDGLGVGRVRIPTLRNIALTAPYMHDGRFATLDAVLDHYQRVGKLPSSAHGGRRDPRLKTFTLKPGERTALKAFLATLTERVNAPQAGH
ncbi:MAG TPA: cytochrome c peroxidase [Steroidobacteraceae bacterium]|nr:cytochrome c peroxidase [Steroidobacteraceae bacterium]